MAAETAGADNGLSLHRMRDLKIILVINDPRRAQWVKLDSAMLIS